MQCTKVLHNTLDIAQHFQMLRNTVKNYFGAVNLDLGHCAIHLDILQYPHTLQNTFKIAVSHHNYSVIIYVCICFLVLLSIGSIGGADRTFACKSQECLWQDWYIWFNIWSLKPGLQEV